MPALLLRSPLLSVRVWRNAPELDAQLAAGSAPAGSPELTLRARQLLRWSFRERLAQQVADRARHEPDPETAQSLHALAVRVSRVEDRNIKAVAAASCLVRRDHHMAPNLERDPRADEVRFLLRGASL